MVANARVLVIGMGNEFRSDDGVGLVLLRQLIEEHRGPYEAWPHAGDASELLEKWHGRDVIVLDALAAEKGQGGRIHLLRPLRGEPLLTGPSLSSHALGLMEAIRIGAVVQRLPRALTVIGVEGESFAPGIGLSPAVRNALGKAYSTLLATLREYEARHA